MFRSNVNSAKCVHICTAAAVLVSQPIAGCPANMSMQFINQNQQFANKKSTILHQLEVIHFS
jgi:hypothetical protein